MIDASKQLIFLTGICGVGKTFYAKKVAQVLGIGWLDLDQLIENSGVRIEALTPDGIQPLLRQPGGGLDNGEMMDDIQQLKAGGCELYTADGKSFRALESTRLKEVLHARNQVVALGGGTLLSSPSSPAAHNRQLIRRSGGLVIWLKEDLHLVAQRLGEERVHYALDKRPLLRQAMQQMEAQQPLNRPVEHLQLALDQLFQQRCAGYQEADLAVDLSYLSTDIAVSLISTQIKEMWHKARNSWS